MREEIDVEVRTFGTSTVGYCRAFAPVFVVVWTGTTTIEAARWAIGTIRDDISAAHRVGQRTAMVSDAVDVQGTTADVRKFFATQNDTLLQEALMANLVVLDSAVVRGIMKAVSWITPKLSAKPVGTSHDAARIVLEAMKQEGVPAPDGFSGAALTRLRARVQHAAPR